MDKPAYHINETRITNLIAAAIGYAASPVLRAQDQPNLTNTKLRWVGIDLRGSMQGLGSIQER
jgi:hypothetical protein